MQRDLDPAEPEPKMDSLPNGYISFEKGEQFLKKTITGERTWSQTFIQKWATIGKWTLPRSDKQVAGTTEHYNGGPWTNGF